LAALTKSQPLYVAVDEVPTGSPVDGLEDGCVQLWLDERARRRRREIVRTYQETGQVGDPDTARLIVGSPRAAATAEQLNRAWAPHPLRSAFVEQQLPPVTQLLKDETEHEAQRTRRVLLHHEARGETRIRRATANLGAASLDVILESSHPDALLEHALQARDGLGRNREVLADLYGWCHDTMEPAEAGWEELLDSALAPNGLEGADAISVTGVGWLRQPLSTVDVEERVPARLRLIAGRVRADDRFVEATEHFVRLFDEGRTTVGRALVANARNAAASSAWIGL